MDTQKFDPKPFLRMIRYAQANSLNPSIWQLEPSFAYDISQHDNSDQQMVVQTDKIVSILGVPVSEVQYRWDYDGIYEPFVLVTEDNFAILGNIKPTPNNEFSIMALGPRNPQLFE